LIYLIGGPTRCGKTELALRLLRSNGLPVVSTDLVRAFMEDLEAGGPQPTEAWSDEEFSAQASKFERSRQRIRPQSFG
jgi:2-phosphoglycerate kinase